ncbi:MAG: Fic family protein [Bacteroidales bacterium]|nr:Fic family protein [Bacteroidales bacterium]
MRVFEEYIRQGEPGRKEKAAAWQTAIGLQGVDGLKPSAYLIDTAKKHIEGDITIADVKQMLDTYYKSKTARAEVEDERTEEADKVSARIEELLTEKSFSFTPEYLARIHRHLFQGIYKFAGRYRDYDITKREWVLEGDTVLYASASMISETLNYDFSQEKQVKYAALDIDKAIDHFAKFISGIWQIHPFGEGNTRTTAVFAMKYLQSFGFEVKDDMFKDHSWYFRNALVRANYNNYPKKVSATNEYLVRYFRNLLLGEDNALKNRDLQISSKPANE